MQFRGELNNSQRPNDGQRPIDSLLPLDGRRPDNVETTCNCCTEDLARLIKCEFRRGDPIGLTFLGQGVATIFIGVFLAIEGTVLVISDLFLDNTISFIPLCSVDSVEMGCALASLAASPMKVAAPQ